MSRSKSLPLAIAALAALAGGCSVNAEDPGSRREEPQVTAEQEPSQASTDGPSTDQATADQVSADRATADRATADRATADRATADQATADQVSADQVSADQVSADQVSADRATAGETQIATLGAGCYWCVEAVFEQLDGVSDVRSGFMGGQVADPSYAAVCSGQTGHAEVVQVRFDPAVLPYEELLDWFWRLHDPTTLNRQGADVGTQYRSAIFFHDEAQQAAAQASRESAAASGAFINPIVTEITAAGPFYEANAEHQDYYRANREASYCRMVIRPKLRKLELDE